MPATGSSFRLASLEQLAAFITALTLFSQAGHAADTSPLRQHLKAKKQAIIELQTRDAAPTHLHVKVTAVGRSGVRRLRIGEKGQFEWLSDSPREGAGFDLGPGSWESLVGTLASAVADEYLVQAASKDIPLDSLDVVFTSIPQRKSANLSYPNNLSYIAYIQSPVTDAKLDELKTAVHANSSVIDLVTKAHHVSPLTVEYIRSSEKRDPGQPPGLREFITEEQVPVSKTNKKPKDPSRAPESRTLTAHTHVEPHTGLRYTFLGKDGYHTALHDSAPELLGYGLAPTVEEHLLGVVTTCPTHIFEIQAAERGVLLDSLELTADADLSPRFGKNLTTPARYGDITYKVRIESPNTAADIEGLRQAVEDTCPLYNLVKHEQKLAGRIVHGAYPAELK
jgi:hypothetical protein